MVLSHLRQRKRTAVETARATFGTHGRPISSKTVRSRLRSVGIPARRPYRGIVLRGHHRCARVRWARNHLRFTRADWAQVLFTDESQFNVQGNDGRTCVYRRRGERYADACVVKTDQCGGGSVMIWAGISFHVKKTTCCNSRELKCSSLPERNSSPRCHSYYLTEQGHDTNARRGNEPHCTHNPGTLATAECQRTDLAVKPARSQPD